MRWFALVLLALTLAGCVAPPAPEPSRSYDAENGVMCYTVPNAISCVRIHP